MMQHITPGKRSGRIVVPPSKSDAQRAIVAASLTTGISTIKNIGDSDDVKALLSCVQLLVAKITFTERLLTIQGLSNFPSNCEINVGESGLAFRMLAGILAAADGEFVITGEGSLKQRSQGFLVQALSSCGVKVSANGDFLPLRITGKLKGGKLSMDGSQSSQHITGLLFGYACSKIPVEIEVLNIKSAPYLEMSIDTLRRFGVNVHVEQNTFVIDGQDNLQPANYEVEGDWSGASYALVAAALGHEITTAGLSMKSKQADKELINLLIASGCQVNVLTNGIQVNGSDRKPMIADLTHCPDLFPAAVAYAVSTPGESRLKGVHRLKNKESDRAAALIKEYASLSVDIIISGDELVIQGSSTIGEGFVDAHGDHRIAMALAVSALNANGIVQINGAEHVAKSFPDFWEQWNALEKIAV